MKLCSRCKTEKNCDQFAVRSRGGLNAYCHPCQKEFAKESYERNRESRNARNRMRWQQNKEKYSVAQKSYMAKNKDKINENRRNNREKLSQNSWIAGIKRRYNLSPEVYEEMLAAQGGGCAICATENPWARSKRFAVDHDHKTGLVRSLLCHPCNRGLGTFSDDAELLRRAAKYLDYHQMNRGK